MSSANVEAQGASRRKFVPMAIVAIMAVLVGVAIAFAAIANGYEGGSYNPVLKPVSVEKQLEPGDGVLGRHAVRFRADRLARVRQ